MNTCLRCRYEWRPRTDERTKQCPNCKSPQWDKAPTGSRAQYHVKKAIERGELPELDGTVPCKDCGKPATGYDHRDYSKPLEVEPVCDSCNHKRGHTIQGERSRASIQVYINITKDEYWQLKSLALSEHKPLATLLAEICRAGIKKDGNEIRDLGEKKEITASPIDNDDDNM